MLFVNRVAHILHNQCGEASGELAVTTHNTPKTTKPSAAKR